MVKLPDGVVLNPHWMKKRLRKSLATVTQVLPRFVMAGFVLATVAAGCTLTQRAPVSVSEQAQQTYCPFLGNSVCAKLTPATDKSEFDLRYVNPNAQWSQYSKVLIDPVSYWGGDSSQLSAADQRTLVNYFSKALNDQLSKKFQVVNQPGPGVMVVSVALLDATAATPGLRSLSVTEPHVRALATLKYLATGTFPFVGSAEAEGKITDSVTGQVLAAAVSKRVGGGSVKAADQWEWGDAENSLTYWATQLTNRLSGWTSGTATS